jgi:hypothetical protein
MSSKPYKPGKPPRRDAGKVSPRTKALRHPTGLSEETERDICRLRREGKTIPEIATQKGVTTEQVQLATRNMRTPIIDRGRGVLNTSPTAPLYVKAEALPGEPCWQTVDRLFEELSLRRMGITPPPPSGI